ncbi:MAG: hypothetical protein K6G52_06925 [Treponemataceae bacterium]|nr:hypothetical protein [Treponemataceae bacterium]
MMSIYSDPKLAKVYELLETLEVEQAKEFLSKELVNDLSNPEILFCLKTCGFWIIRKGEICELTEMFEKAERYLLNWKDFIDLMGEDIKAHEQCLYSIRKGVFSTALDLYQSILEQTTSQNSSQVPLLEARIALCYKEVGDYELAKKCLEEAHKNARDNAQILAEMADCYALCGDDKMSKLLFREAFFIAPQEIDIKFLESEMFCRLYEKVKQKYPDDAVAAEWIPVEGLLLGVLNVKRELSSIEVGKLKQNIFAIDAELKNNGSQSDLLIPRLINNYFWLIDHYVATNEDDSKISDVLRSIKLLNKDIFERYTV